jgi:hypothetical protein
MLYGEREIDSCLINQNFYHNSSGFMIIRISEKSSYFFAGKHRSESRENKRFISNSPFIKVPFLHLKPSVKGFWVNFK